MKADRMSERIYLITVALPFGTVLVIFAMKYLAAARQAHARLLSADAYRSFAEHAAATQAQTAASLASMQAELVRIGSRLGAVETMLREVE